MLTPLYSKICKIREASTKNGSWPGGSSFPVEHSLVVAVFGAPKTHAEVVFGRSPGGRELKSKEVMFSLGVLRIVKHIYRF